VALPRFRERALEGGGWRPEGGASLATYFMGTCVDVFPNEFRRWRAQGQRWRRQNARDTSVEAEHMVDPADLALTNLDAHEHLDSLSREEQVIVQLTMLGYSQEEIAELLGKPSARAVEGVLYRLRNKARSSKGMGRGEQ
jgi:DNA-directed RNA polymerase specialized sigma24 family protein